MPAPNDTPGILSWYDPAASGGAWQDSAGTTPAGVGDPVGRLSDLSGNGRHLTSSGSNRPTRTSSGVDCGGGKYLANTSFGGGTPTTASIVARMAVRSWNTGFHRLFSTSSDSVADHTSGIAYHTANVTRSSWDQLYADHFSGGYDVSFIDLSPAPAFATLATFACTVNISGSSVVNRINGTAQSARTPRWSSVALSRFAICAFLGPTIDPAYSANITVGRLLVTNSALTGSDLTDAEAWAGGVAAITGTTTAPLPAPSSASVASVATASASVTAAQPAPSFSSVASASASAATVAAQPAPSPAFVTTSSSSAALVPALPSPALSGLSSIGSVASSVAVSPSAPSGQSLAALSSGGQISPSVPAPTFAALALLGGNTVATLSASLPIGVAQSAARAGSVSTMASVLPGQTIAIFGNVSGGPPVTSATLPALGIDVETTELSAEIVDGLLDVEMERALDLEIVDVLRA